ncbi:MAG: hypothetical protein AB8B85_17655 [Paracoccaceae bacterium]
MTALNSTAFIWAVILFGAAPAIAAECALNYEQFEIGVPHTDLEICPESMAEAGTYCRLSLVGETVTIFAFAEATDCLVATRVYSDEEFKLTVN